MKILSIDTSSNICAVAILEDEKLIKEISLDNGLTHSEKLMPEIQEILFETNLELTDMDLLVCDVGPGSFTGIRIGISTILAFSDSLGINSVGVSSLESLAYNIKEDGIICSLIDAKHSNCYCGIYKLENGNYTLLEELIVDNINNIIDKLQNYDSEFIFIGNGAIVNKAQIIEKIQNCKFTNNNNLNAYNLGLAGIHAFSNKTSHDIKPLYLRKSQAERMLEEKDNANK